MAESLQKTGVEAVVEGLASFKSDVDDMNSKIGEIGSKGNILTRVLGGAWEMLENLGASAIRVAEYALGQLLAGAIEFVISKLGQLISATIQAGAEFQTMELRLKRLNFNTAIAGTEDYNEAMEIATTMTKDQLAWIQRLAVQTPYDAQDIANVFTLARSYGFASNAAQGLTQDITDFASGMGLGSTEIERIIVNFGQMVQQGKVTQRELNDLARGSFVPVNDVIKRMEENTGKTGKAFDKFKSSGEGVNAFFTAFSQIVEERFQGAAQDMARTFQGATANAQDFLKSLIGFNVVRPILNEVGGAIADVINKITEGEKWEMLNTAAERMGESFRQVLAIFLHIFGLNLDGLAERLVSGMNSVSDWIQDHRDDIYQFFFTMRARIMEVWQALKGGDFGGFLKAIGLDDQMIDKIIKFKDGIVEAFETIKSWVDENGPLIEKFFSTLGEIVAGVFAKLTGGAEVGGGLESLLAGVASFMTFVVEHQEDITNFVTTLIKMWAVLQVIGFVLSVVGGIVMTFVGFLLSLAGVILTVIAVVTFLLSPIGLLALALVALGVTIAVFGEDAAFYFEYLKQKASEWVAVLVAGLQNVGTQIGLFIAKAITGFNDFQTKIQTWRENAIADLTDFFTQGIEKVQAFVDGAVGFFEELNSKFADLVQKIIAKVKNTNWIDLGRGIIRGMIQGVKDAVGGLINAVKDAVGSAISAAQNVLQAYSPSHVFIRFGESTMEGLAMGIQKMAGTARQSMVKAMTGVTMPAINLAYSAAGMGSTVNTTNNFGLTINSSASQEPILQDFGMLQSLIQG